MLSELEPLLTEQDAAKVLKTHPGTLRNWRSKGMGPAFIKVGDAVRYSPDGLRQYIDVHTRRTVNSKTRN